MNNISAFYRFIAICYLAVMGLIGTVRRHVGTFQNDDLFGEEAFAFGIACLGGAVLFACWDFYQLRRHNVQL